MTELVDQLPRALQGTVRAMLAFKSVFVVISCRYVFLGSHCALHF